MSLEQLINQAWYQDKAWVGLLKPLTPLYLFGLNQKRKQAAQKANQLPVPVVVLGNISVGGTGKTPLIEHLASLLQQRGFKVGIISRGYGARANRYPYLVSAADSVDEVGDEPLMLVQTLKDIPLVIDPDRFAAARHLLATCPQVQVILSDDGMQHYALPRDLEILVVDGQRELGNELVLPAGPLREPLERLKSVDFCLVNGDQNLKSNALRYIQPESFQLQPLRWTQVSSGTSLDLDTVDKTARTIAIAGIGNPSRFYATLESLGLQFEKHSLDDHQAVSESELRQLGVEDKNTQVLMTHKDAVKCRDLIQRNNWQNTWALDVGVNMNADIENQILDAIQRLIAKNQD